MASGFWNVTVLKWQWCPLSLRGLRPRQTQRCGADPVSLLQLLLPQDCPQECGDLFLVNTWWDKGTLGGHTISVAQMTCQNHNINMGGHGFSLSIKPRSRECLWGPERAILKPGLTAQPYPPPPPSPHIHPRTLGFFQSLLSS